MKDNEPIFITDNGKSPTLITFILFWQTAREASKYVDSFLYKHANISTIHMIVLQSIEHNNGIMSPSEIAHWTNTKRHNITTLIRRMKKEGMVRIERDKKDRRNVNVIITDKGRLVLTNAIPIAQEAINQVMSSISNSDISPVQRVFTLMRKNVYDGISKIT